MTRSWGIGAWFLIAFLLIPSAAQGQVLIALLFGEKLSTERFQLGVNASFAASAFMGFKDRMLPGWSLSVYGEIRLHERFHLQPELALKFPGGADDLSSSIPGYPFAAVGEPTIDGVVNEGKVKRELRYVALPILGRVLLGPVGLGIGPQLGVLVHAQDTTSQKEGATRVSLSRSVAHELRRVDAGIVLSLDYSFWKEQKMRSLRIRGTGYVGLVDTIRNNPHGAIRNWNVMLGLDIPIGGPRKSEQAR